MTENTTQAVFTSIPSAFIQNMTIRTFPGSIACRMTRRSQPTVPDRTRQHRNNKSWEIRTNAFKSNPSILRSGHGWSFGAYSVKCSQLESQEYLPALEQDRRFDCAILRCGRAASRSRAGHPQCVVAVRKSKGCPSAKYRAESE